MEKKKLKLEEIKVESFITTIEGMGFAGGSYPTQNTCTCTEAISCNGNTCAVTCPATCVNTCGGTGTSGGGTYTISYC